MKKSLSRALSLALVLVMLIGVMPMTVASAAEPETTYSCDATHTFAETPNEGGTEASCTVDGVKVYACTKVLENGTACTGVKTVTTPKTGHAVPENGWTVTTPATCVTEGVKAGKCAVCQADVTDVIEATGVHDFQADGKCKNCTATQATHTATISAATLTLNVGKTATLSVTLDPAYTNAKVSFSSDDTNVATVGATSGIVTAVKKGTANITATITEPAGVAAVTCEVTVKDGGYIECNHVETASGSATLTPKLFINGKEVAAKFDFTVGTSTESNKSSMTLTRSKYGVVPVTVSVNSYTGSNGQAGDTSVIEDEVVYVAFYEVINAAATVRSGVTSFMFDDNKVFSSVKYDNIVYNNPENYTMQHLWVSEHNWYNMVLNQKDPDSRVATITYPGSVFNAFDPDDYNDYSDLTASGLKFTCLSKGAFTFSYDLEDATTGMTVQKGDITITVQDGGKADITYTTASNKDFSLDEKDFERFWTSMKMAEDPEYIVFENDPDEGALYTDTDKKYAVDKTDKFYFTGTTDRLKNVTFAPGRYMTAGEETLISFTMYDDDGDSLVGTMMVKVEDMPFTDVAEKDWFYNDVVYVYNEGIMTGTSATKFSPNSTLTRGMVVTMLYRIEGEPTVRTSGTFTDVAKDQWYTNAVEWAAKNEIVNGLGNNKFGPNQNITREQLAAILYRYADYKNMGTQYGSGLTKFTDYKSVSSYAEDALEWAVYEGIITGDGNKLLPKGNATRAQAAAMFHRFLED